MPWMVSTSYDGKCQPDVEFDRDHLKLGFYMYGQEYGRNRMGGMDSGLPAPRELVPTAARITSTGGWRGCDLLHLFSLWAVSERFKAKVEELEPGVHEFFPIDIRTKSGEPVDGAYFLLNICNRTDAIDETKSILRHDVSTNTFYRNGLGKVTPRTVFHEEKIAGMCMWRDVRIPKTDAFFSDTLMDFVRENKMISLDSIEVF